VIYDMSGKLFYQEAFTRTQNSMLKQINVSGYQNGTYIIKITSDNKSVSIKMVKQ
jgi:Secretion system C-terminal sorting domain